MASRFHPKHLRSEIENSDEKKKERSSRSASYGHMQRRLTNNQPLTGKTLELALEIVDVQGDDDFSTFIKGMRAKIQTGQPLDDYELHILLDVLLVHHRLNE